MSKACICKACKTTGVITTFPRFEDLKLHYAIEHRATYQAVKTWLDDTTAERLAVYEAMAKEGMTGRD